MKTQTALFASFLLMMTQKPNIWIALPAMNEAQWLPGTLAAIEKQSYRCFKTVICVNQPKDYTDSQSEREQNIYQNNQQTLSWLNDSKSEQTEVLDKSSKGKAWPSGKGSVGAARKFLMDYIAAKADEQDIILSMDADSSFDSDYFTSVLDVFDSNPGISGLSNPYYHRLSNNTAVDRAMLRYEIYMRNYAINQFRIGSPWRFTALGSAMATTVKMYRRIGGMTAKKSGEDFYFLQKLLKAAPLYLHNNELVYPAARFSDRVFFGTGPAMIKGSKGDWSSYPVYPARLFDNVAKTQKSFSTLYQKDIHTPMDHVLGAGKEMIWTKLRNNVTSERQFIKACHQKVDGLRILQYLKAEQAGHNEIETQVLKNNLEVNGLCPGEAIVKELSEHSTLADVSTKTLAAIREMLFQKEKQLQQQQPITAI